MPTRQNNNNDRLIRLETLVEVVTKDVNQLHTDLRQHAAEDGTRFEAIQKNQLDDHQTIKEVSNNVGVLTTTVKEYVDTTRKHTKLILLITGGGTGVAAVISIIWAVITFVVPLLK